MCFFCCLLFDLHERPGGKKHPVGAYVLSRFEMGRGKCVHDVLTPIEAGFKVGLYAMPARLSCLSCAKSPVSVNDAVRRLTSIH